jgi:hypothetical protein
VNSGNWVCVCRSNSVETTSNTSTAIDTSNYQALEIEVNASASSASFYINGASVATIATNIPSGATRATGICPVWITKSAGTTTRAVAIDLVEVRQEYTSAL